MADNVMKALSVCTLVDDDEPAVHNPYCDNTNPRKRDTKLDMSDVDRLRREVAELKMLLAVNYAKKTANLCPIESFAVLCFREVVAESADYYYRHRSSLLPLQLYFDVATLL